MFRRPAVFVFVSLVLAPWTAVPADEAENPLDEVEQCVRRNLPQRTSVQEVQFRSRDRTGGERVLETEFLWKRFEQDSSRSLIRVKAPPDLRGSTYLLMEDDTKEQMFVYLPELQRVRRVTPHSAAGSLFGTDLSYEDFRYLRRVMEGSSEERLPDAEIDGRAVYQVGITPPEDDGSDYERIVAFVDRETCVPLKMEFYERGEKLRKRLTVDPAQLERQAAIWVPRTMSIEDLREETQTKMVVEKTEVETDLPDRIFTTSGLERGH